MNGVEFEGQEDSGVQKQLIETQAELRELQGDIGSMAKAFDVPEANDAVELVSSAVEALEALGAAAANEEDGGASALQAVTALNAAQLQLESADLQISVLGPPDTLSEAIEVRVLDTAFESAGFSHRRFIKPDLKGVIGKLKAVLAKAWHLVSRLVTPKEWKVSGEVAGGIPGIGLAKAGIEITFG
jgi:hypothetical protein